MRILFNAYPVVTPPLTGVGQYARRLLAGLEGRAPDIEVVCFSEDRVIPMPSPETMAPPARRGLAQRAARSLAYRLPFARALRRSLGGRGVANRHRDAIYHEPNHILQPFDGRSVVTIHDLSVLRFPQFHPASRVRYFTRNLRDTLDRADRIIVDSGFIGRELTTEYGVDAARIRMVPLGVAAEFRAMTAAETAGVLATHGLRPGGYVLAVGTREPRKNLERLVAAYLMLPAALRTRCPLALVGPRGWRAAGLEERFDALERDGQIRRLGYVPDAERPALYAGAAGLAYPSLYEGFGLPPLEAAASGVPVLTSRDSPMEEVLGGTAVLVDPLDVDAIRAGLVRLVQDDAMREEAARLGPGWGARFGWESCVARTVAVYRELA
jgi:alpha-1,3-rhamnosyl/mannosyltransferase